MQCLLIFKIHSKYSFQSDDKVYMASSSPASSLFRRLFFLGFPCKIEGKFIPTSNHLTFPPPKLMFTHWPHPCNHYHFPYFTSSPHSHLIFPQTSIPHPVTLAHSANHRGVHTFSSLHFLAHLATHRGNRLWSN